MTVREKIAPQKHMLLARTPPMGWRSWNLYGLDVDQKLMHDAMRALATDTRPDLDTHRPTTLCDLGYCDAGLDDAWQLCGAYGPQNYTYHTTDGAPLVNTSRFPSLRAMVDHAHALNLTAGWYLNNCYCADHCGSGGYDVETDPKCYKGDVAALAAAGFDGVKLDNCGKQRDLDLWATLLRAATGGRTVIENCHWGETTPNATHCPYQLYRTSVDVRPTYGSVLANLATTARWARANLSRPGCWAYPDMLEVGVSTHVGRLSPAEARTHFGAWAIVSSPLVLSHNVTDRRATDELWELIANREAIAINQAWAGHSGSPFARSAATVRLSWREAAGLDEPRTRATVRAREARGDDVGALVERAHDTPEWQYLYKPLTRSGSRVAVLLLNSAASARDLALDFRNVPSLACAAAAACAVRCVWSRRDLGVFEERFIARAVGSHDARLLVVSNPGAKVG